MYREVERLREAYREESGSGRRGGAVVIDSRFLIESRDKNKLGRMRKTHLDGSDWLVPDAGRPRCVRADLWQCGRMSNATYKELLITIAGR